MSLFVLVRAPTPFTCGRQRWPLTTIIHRPRGQGCEDRHPQSRIRYPQRTHGRGQAPFRIGRGYSKGAEEKMEEDKGEGGSGAVEAEEERAANSSVEEVVPADVEME